MAVGNKRWEVVEPSQFPHEQEGLDLLAALLPDEQPFRAWSNFSFCDSDGRWHEIDALVLGRSRLHLVELKYWRGTITGTPETWERNGKSERSPLLLAKKKAERLQSRLNSEWNAWARASASDAAPRVPFVQHAIFFHHPGLAYTLDQKRDLFGLDLQESRSGLPGISKRILETPKNRALGGDVEEMVSELLASMRISGRTMRQYGSWLIGPSPVHEDGDRQVWPAEHIVRGQSARASFRIVPPRAPDSDVAAARHDGKQEFDLSRRLDDDIVVPAEDVVDSELGIGVVYPSEPDHVYLDDVHVWPTPTRLNVMAAVAQAVAHLHMSGYEHGCIVPSAVTVGFGQPTPSVRLTRWHAARPLDVSRPAAQPDPDPPVIRLGRDGPPQRIDDVLGLAGLAEHLTLNAHPEVLKLIEGSRDRPSIDVHEFARRMSEIAARPDSNVGTGAVVIPRQESVVSQPAAVVDLGDRTDPQELVDSLTTNNQVVVAVRDGQKIPGSWLALLSGLAMSVPDGTLTGAGSNRVEVRWPAPPVWPSVRATYEPRRVTVTDYGHELTDLARAIRRGDSIEIEVSSSEAETRTRVLAYLAGVCLPLPVALERSATGRGVLIYRR